MPSRLQGRARCHRARHAARAQEKAEYERLAAGLYQRHGFRNPPSPLARSLFSSDRLTRVAAASSSSAPAMAIAAATKTSVADEVETEPDLEPNTELHLRGRGRRCPFANVKGPPRRG